MPQAGRRPCLEAGGPAERIKDLRSFSSCGGIILIICYGDDHPRKEPVRGGISRRSGPERAPMSRRRPGPSESGKRAVARLSGSLSSELVRHQKQRRHLDRARRDVVIVAELVVPV